MASNETTHVTRAARAAKLRGIYAILNEGECNTVAIGRAALESGVRVVQYRAKCGIVPENVRDLRKLTQLHDALLILNDDWQAAVALDCDGVHLGPDDRGFPDIAPVRAIMDERLIGLSCGTIGEATAVDEAAVDYLGVGSVFATASKTDAGAPIGLAGLRAIAGCCSLPVAAIGGIDRDRVASVRATGVAMAALISAIFNAVDPAAAARELVQTWNQGAE